MFGKNRLKSEFEKLNRALSASFGHVRQDTQNIFEWITYLHQKNQQQEQVIHQLTHQITHQLTHQPDSRRELQHVVTHFNNKLAEQDEEINQLNSQLNHMPTTREEIKRIIDEHYSYENFHNKIAELDSRIGSLVHIQREEIESVKRGLNVMPNNQAVLDKVRELDDRIGYVEKNKPMSVRERIIKKITRNSKEYVKSVILSLLRKYGKTNGLQIKEIVVDEQGLCSKSSFYRLLGELEELDELSVAWVGKEKHYVHKALKSV